MAIFRHGPLAGAISGSLGGCIFAQGKTAPTVRRRPAPSRQPTAPRAAHNLVLAACAAAWRDISDAERLTWTVRAYGLRYISRIGLPFTPTARQVFFSTNIPRIRGGISIQEATPSGGRTPAPVGTYAVLDASSNYWIQYDELVVGSLGPFQVQAYRPCQQHPTTSMRAWTYIDTHAIKMPGEVITAKFQAALGVLDVGEYVYFRVRDMKTGFLTSAPFIFEAVCVP